MVGREAFFACMQGFETAGVPTRFPHPSQLYRTLLSKDRSRRSASRAVLRAAHHDRQPRARGAHPRSAARGALALAAIRATRDATKEKKKKREAAGADGGEPLPGLSRRSAGRRQAGVRVAAAHVDVARRDAARDGAGAARRRRGARRSSSAGLVPNCSRRARTSSTARSSTPSHDAGETDADGYQVDFARKEREAALGAWLDGDEAAMAHLERRMRKLTRRCSRAALPLVEAVPAIRIDFLVKRRAPGKVDVHTLELTEAGFSMLGWRDGPTKVFDALAEACFEDEAAKFKDAAAAAIKRHRTWT